MYYTLCFLVFRTIRFHEHALLWGIRILVGSSCLLHLEGFRQLLFGYAIPPDVDQVTQLWMQALSGRVFSKFALPSQFAGYLLMLIPVNGVLVYLEEQKSLKFLWSILFVTQGVLFFYTKSFGAWVALLGVLMIGTILWFSSKHRITFTLLMQGSIGFLVGGGVILFLIGYVRGQYLWNFHGNNPLWYRLLNWKTALEIFRDHIFLGTGLFTFGTMYPQYMQPGANEAQFAHNTYLQFGAEAGLIGLILSAGLAIAWSINGYSRIYRALSSKMPDKPSLFEQRRTFIGISCFFGGLGFLLHNIVDFDFYVFPLGLLGVALLGLTSNLLSSSNSEHHSDNSSIGSRRILFAILLSGMIIPLYIYDCRTGLAEQEKEQAIASLKHKQYQDALTSITHAREIFPDSADYTALEGSVRLNLHQADSAIERFHTAIQTVPDMPWFHAGLAEAYLQEKNLSMAYLESRQAAELFPHKQAYRERPLVIQQLLSRIR